MEPKEANVTTKYKDRLFSFIFGQEENREWTLSLYNAVNDSDYKDASLIEFNTLCDVLFIGMKNDTSFIISDIMSVYEHQSSLNLNTSVKMALDSMPKDFEIHNFLTINRQEVQGMLDTEYNEAEVQELFTEEGIRIGIAQRDKEKITGMLNRGKTPEDIADFCDYPLEQVMSVLYEINAKSKQ